MRVAQPGNTRCRYPFKPREEGYGMKQIKIRKTGSIRLTSACGSYSAFVF
jgi:hypothetical protein